VQAVAGDEETMAYQKIDNVKELVASTEGKDTTRARSHLRLAENFLNKGNYEKAMYYADKAENALK
jgi:hypothetical protein